ncbi:MAG: hypothetical protein SNJ75_03100 [Gemmataceae bacterium]
MNRSLLLLAGLLASVAVADEKATNPDKATSPTLPAPEGLTFVKHPKADNLRTPEGFALDRVAELGPDVRTVVMDDTNAYLLRGGTKDAILPLSWPKWTAGKPLVEEAGITALAAFDGQLYFATPEGLHRFFDGKRTTLVQGLGIVGITLGTDGWLYLNTIEGDSDLIGHDGSKATSCRTGAIFRCTPEGNKLHLFALGVRHVAGPLAFDLAGHAFAVDADLPDAGRFTGCRLIHLADGGDYGYRLAFGAKAHKPDLHRAAAWGEAPGTLTPLLKTGRGEPSGLYSYHDTQLPERYRGLLYYPDVRDRTVRAYRLKPKNATFRVVEEFVFVTGGDAFRPCALFTGPEGALYVVDRGHDKGLLWRLSWKGTEEDEALPLRDVAKRDDLMAEADALKGLAAPDASERFRARTSLRKGGDRVRGGLLTLLANEEQPWTARMMAVGCLLALDDAEVRKGLLAKLGNSDAEVQRVCAEAYGILAAGSANKDAHAALLRGLAEEDPHLKRSVALALARNAHPGVGDNLAATLSFDKGNCPVLRDGLLRGLESLGKLGLTALRTMAASGAQREIDLVAHLYCGLRTEAALEDMPELLKNPHLTTEQRVALVRASIRMPHRTLDPIVLAIAANDKEPAEVKRAALEILAVPGVRFGPMPAVWAARFLNEGDADLRAAATMVLQARLKARDVSPEERETLLKALKR